MDTIKFSEFVSLMNDTPSGGFVGIKDYTSKKGDVTSVVGHLGFSYDVARQKGIDALKTALEADILVEMTITGQCRSEDGIFNARKRSWDLVKYSKTYSKEEVVSYAKEILEGWENPKARKSNKMNLTDKENGLVYNAETGTFNFMLLVESETYNKEASALLKEGMDVKPENKAPESKLKEAIRKQFERKLKSYTITNGNFKQLALNGRKFSSDKITF